MTQNIYDDDDFFAGYAALPRQVHGLEGAPEWGSVKAMLPHLGGLRVADLGCGYGWFCRFARQQGAEHVLGLDVSEKMLRKAASMTADPHIEYRREDLEELTLPARSFDLAYSSLTLHYIQDLKRLVSVVYDALDVNGHFVFSMEHPIYTAPANPGWIVDGQGVKSWPVNQYQLEGKRVTNWIAEGVVKQHRTLGTCLNLLINLGFALSRVEEWGPTKEQIARHPALDEEKERPMLVLVSAKKQS